MAVLMISYDLNDEKNYPKLIDAIKAYGNWTHVMRSLWLISTNYSAGSVFNNLKTRIDKNDYLFVNQLTRDHQGWLHEDAVQWLSDNPPY